MPVRTFLRLAVPALVFVAASTASAAQRVCDYVYVGSQLLACVGPSPTGPASPSPTPTPPPRLTAPPVPPQTIIDPLETPAPEPTPTVAPPVVEGTADGTLTVGA